MRYGWQLESALWTRLAELCVGREWNRTYLENMYRTMVPSSSGIYLICASASDGLVAARPFSPPLYNAVYVGQATDLRRRFDQHVRGYGNVPRARAIFRRLHYWYVGATEAELNEVEQCFINALGPCANDRNVRVRIGMPVPAGSI